MYLGVNEMGQVQIILSGGPHDGEKPKYFQPLPEILCLAERNRQAEPIYHDYKRRDKDSKPPHIYDWIGKTSARRV